jgi:excisionase family DNA binding protein
VSTDHVDASLERLADDAASPRRDIVWLSTQDAARRLGVTPRTLYRFIDEGQLPAYRFGRVIRLQLDEVDEFIERCRIQPGSLEHLYPESVGAASGGAHDE